MGNRINKCRGRRKWFKGKGGDQIPKTKKKQYYIILKIILYSI
jgi:hypothetical protein